MNQEHLTPAEQKQVEQNFLSEIKERENREIERKEKTLEENFQGKMHQKQQSFHDGVKEVQEEEEGPPDPQKDFMGYMQWLGKTLQKQGLLREKQQPKPAVCEAEQLHTFYQQSVASIKQKHHDFDQAADFIYETRAKQLAACASLYPEMADPQNIDAVIGNELKQILRDCAQKNQNPAEVIYSIAQKIGYTNVPNNMGENLQERHNSARTLSAYNGLTPNGPISLDMLDKMSEAEFSTWVADPKNKAAFNRLMGGKEF
ncbi:hypothetical protein [Bartonella rattimassiliensis]|uniref:Phage protein n=1 Tax=Bartonella rattimassiliensis 15908 TaxID=1094556 RepID=J1JT20_9HYPH|nr:hypothetical protein [Bartonella rattimassiliensis]EJF88022.1 hypothetical protein MCY_00019 [Bartonella rattimassiliensis 15908]